MFLIMLSLTMAVPAHAFQAVGAIGTKYQALGGPAGPLGPVVSDEADFPGGGRISRFANGAATWHPRYGAHAVWGLIGAKWLAQAVRYGVPVTDELAAPNGGRFNDFANNATIDFHPRFGTHAVVGLIRARWVALGREGGLCGYPVGDEIDVPGGRASRFANGTITWRAGTPIAEVRCGPGAGN